MITQQQINVESPPDAMLPTERWALLLKIAQNVENPVFAVDRTMIQGLLLDLACLFQNAEERPEYSESIFEDRQGRSDELGNIRMIYSTKRSFVEPRMLKWLSKQLFQLNHEFVQRSLEMNSQGSQLQDMDFHMDDWDLRATDQLLDAKQRVVALRRELAKSEAKNQKLWGRLKWLEQSKKKLIAHHSAQVAKAKPPVKGTKSKSTKSDFMSENESDPEFSTRNGKTE